MIPLSLVSSGYSLAHNEAGKQQTPQKLRGKKRRKKVENKINKHGQKIQRKAHWFYSGMLYMAPALFKQIKLAGK